MSKFRLVPPAGAPLPTSAVLSSALRGPEDKKDLEGVIRNQFKARHVFTVSSGRAALTIMIRALKKMSDRREVVIPAYTCFSVPSAVVRAQMTIRLCDVDPKTLDLDRNVLTRLGPDNVLCIIPSSLYGLPSGLVALEKLARTSGAYLVDDAAQCLGASLDGKGCGTFGDAGFYSLGRGKNITTMGGGILVTQRDDLAELVQHEVDELPRPSSVNILSSTVSSLLYAGMVLPSRYWVIDRMPFLGLGSSVFDPDFKMTTPSSYQKRLASQLLPFVSAYNRIRTENASQLKAGVEGVEGIEIPQPINGATPVYLRFPILARGKKHRSRLINRLKDAGIRASASYPMAIGDIPGISRYLAADQQPCPAAASIAERIITLPTHPYVTVGDVDKMIQIIRDES